MSKSQRRWILTATTAAARCAEHPSAVGRRATFSYWGHNRCQLPSNLPARPLSQHQIRSLFSKRPPTEHGPVLHFLFKFFAYTGLFILVSGGLVVAFFVYDATTYKEGNTVSDIPVSEQALSPKRGGPKNLPIANVLVDDEDSPEMLAQKDKPKLVILGTGWGSIALLKNLNPGDYHVTVVSPVNHFLFTPMLPSATVGTLEFRSLIEPVRRIVQRVRGHFLQGQAASVDFSEKLVEISQVDSKGNKMDFYLPYDKLVIGVGKSIPCETSKCNREATDCLQAPQQIHMASKAWNIAIS